MLLLIGNFSCAHAFSSSMANPLTTTCQPLSPHLNPFACFKNCVVISHACLIYAAMLLNTDSVSKPCMLVYMGSKRWDYNENISITPSWKDVFALYYGLGLLYNSYYMTRWHSMEWGVNHQWYCWLYVACRSSTLTQRSRFRQFQLWHHLLQTCPYPWKLWTKLCKVQANTTQATLDTRLLVTRIYMLL